MKEIPEVRIQFSWLLHGSVSEQMYEGSEFSKKHKYPSEKQCEEWAENYRQAWQPKSQKILKGMQESLDLKFNNPVIDVTLAPMFKGMSNPLIIGFGVTPNQFIDLLTHELYHVLLTDNNKFSNRNKSQLKGTKLGYWKELFGEEHEFNTLVHIPVHAGLKYVYLDVLDEPDRLSRDIKECQKLPGYKEAWDYVENNDYKKILKKLSMQYDTLKTEN